MTGSMDSIDFQELALSYYAAVISIVAVLTIPGLVYVIHAHLKAQGIPFSLKAVFSPFNATLLGAAISLAGLCASNSYATSPSGLKPERRVNIAPLQATFACCFHIFYVLYSYIRSRAIIHLQLTKLERAMKLLCYIISLFFGLSLLFQILASLLPTSAMLVPSLGTIAPAMNAAGSISAFVFDVVLLATFSKGTRAVRQKEEPDNDDMRLVIICKYGTLAIVAYFVSDAAFVASVALPSGIKSDSLSELSQTLLLCVYLILFAMKVALHENVNHTSTIVPAMIAIKGACNNLGHFGSSPTVTESIEIECRETN